MLNTGEPTFMGANGQLTHIDITVTTSDIATISTWKPYHDTMYSDHFPLIIEVDSVCPATLVPERWRVKDANCSKYEKMLKLPSTFENPTQACQSIIDSINSAATGALEKSPMKINPKYTRNWWSEECQVAHKLQQEAQKQYKKNLGNLKYWIELKKAKAVAGYTIRKAKKKSWDNYLASITSKTTSQEIWRKMRSIKGNLPAKTLSVQFGNKVLSKPQEVADALAKHFGNKLTVPTGDPFFVAHREAIESRSLHFEPSLRGSYNELFTRQELESALHSCKSKAAGADSIPYILLQHIPTSQINNLLLFYNFLWTYGFPEQWHHYILVPLLKPGKCALDPESYRMIALTNCLCKIYEKMANKRLQHYLEINNVLVPYQSGFRKSRGTLDPLVGIEHAANMALKSKGYCIAIFLDIARAFDAI